MEHEHKTNPRDKGGSLCHGQVADSGAMWAAIRRAAGEMAAEEAHLQRMLEDVVLSRSGLAESLAARLSRRLSREDMQRAELEPLLGGVLRENGMVLNGVARDMEAIVDRDPACKSALEPLLFYKGFLAICAYRVAHCLWTGGRKPLVDHATSVVIGETAIIEDNVSILHEVTLGGTGKETGDRHPVVRSGVLIGAGAKILGRVEIGEGAKIGAGSVVLDDVPPHKTVAGVPAVVVGVSSEENPALDMNQRLSQGSGL